MRNKKSQIDSPERMAEARDLIQKKKSLHSLYSEFYDRYAEVLARCPQDGVTLELGSGGGFAKERIPELVTSDFVAAPGIDQVIDATKMPFADQSLRAIFMLNTFHHIPDAEAFFREASRCLKPGGRILMIDQHLGFISEPILKYLHSEPFDSKTTQWQFQSTGPLSGANSALTWMVFQRDRTVFEKLFPTLKIIRYEPHTPLRYWFSGGLKRWNLIPPRAIGLARRIDNALTQISPHFGSFVDVEIQSSH